MSALPEEYGRRMKRLLGAEYEAYLASMERGARTAFRINTAKVSRGQWEKINPFQTAAPVLWSSKGFYYDSAIDAPSKHPYYYAGLYYIQEPSAMIPAEILPVQPGQRLLDLCAAPGGKATELGARLGRDGFLLANDISVSRCRALAKNLQMAGIYNSAVTAESPEHLAEVFGGFFDGILVDAPCSGEGMFRREPRMIQNWLEKGPSYYAPLQKEILGQAYRMLKPGGSMVYSTCTFSVEENEEVIQWFFKNYPDMELCPVERKAGFSEGRPELTDGGTEELRHCIRIYPHRAEGEGHFAALLKKKAAGRLPPGSGGEAQGRQKDSLPAKEIHRFCKRQAGEFPEIEQMLLGLPLPAGYLEWKDDRLRWLPDEVKKMSGLRLAAAGLPICERKRKVQWSKELALSVPPEYLGGAIDFSVNDGRVIRYLKGETLQTESRKKGMLLISVDGYGLGWCQGNGSGMLKNKYYPGWRYQ